jgi:hypothetical protein
VVVVRGRVTARAGVAVAVGALLVGCSGGGESASDAGGGSSGLVSADEAASVEREAADGVRSGSTPRTAGRPAVQTRLVISTGRVDLVTDDLEAARNEVDRLLGRYGGHVAKERTSKDDDGESDRSKLELRVPSRHFDQLMQDLEELGTADTQREDVDVTTEVIDVDSRIRTQEVSIDRLRGFLGDATDVNAMIRLESEIARREADLASLRAQQEYLDDQTSLATITVTMTTPEAAPERDDDPLEDAGFLSGLSGGWNALLDVVVVLATVVGALLPFAVVLAVLATPLLVWLRTARRRRTAAAPPA